MTTVSGLTHSQRLRFKLSMVMPELGLAGAVMRGHPRLIDILPRYLYTTHCMIRASVPLMRVAAERCHDLADSDAVAAALAPYYTKHIREEMHHDDWLLEDMALLGLDADAARARHAPADVAELIGAQHYWLTYTHPLTLLGCFAVLEGSPPEVETLDAVAERTGLTRAALRTLYKHAQLDPHHRDDLDDVLDTLPLAPEHEAMLGLSALHVVDRLGDILARLLAADPPEA
jgi:hypothetical protein